MMTYTAVEINIIRRALPAVDAAAASEQNTCWPGDGPVHDDHCHLTDHRLSRRAVRATEGMTWDFTSWSSTATWMRRALEEELINEFLPNSQSFYRRDPPYYLHVAQVG